MSVPPLKADDFETELETHSVMTSFPGGNLGQLMVMLDKQNLSLKAFGPGHLLFMDALVTIEQKLVADREEMLEQLASGALNPDIFNNVIPSRPGPAPAVPGTLSPPVAA